MVIIADTYAHALDELYDQEMTIISGGTDVMVKKRNWAGLAPVIDQDILNISGLDELRYIKEDKEGIHIGANTTLEDMLKSTLICEPLKAAVREMASPAIRHVGTIGGNIGNASPAGDTLPVLYVYDTMIVLESVEGTREVSISEFITGPGSHIRKKDELIKEIILKDLGITDYYYEKVGGRQSDAISKVAFVGTYTKDDEGMVTDIRMAFGAVYKTVIRNRNLELELLEVLNHHTESKKTIQGKSNVVEAINFQAVSSVMDAFEKLIQPIDDQRSTANYRRKCSMNLLKSFILSTGGI